MYNRSRYPIQLFNSRILRSTRPYSSTTPVYKLEKSGRETTTPTRRREEKSNKTMLHLDGSMLEGGGQLVRNAVALSALTGRPVRISHIRGKRSGARGLKASHCAAINFLLEVCGGVAIGNDVGSHELKFYPRGTIQAEEEEIETVQQILEKSLKALGLDNSTSNSNNNGNGNSLIKPEYNIRLSTPGSVFLIFQALYPYLLLAGSVAYSTSTNQKEKKGSYAEKIDGIKLNITGGTNVSFSPSYEYVSQVLIPNFAKFGLPPLSVSLGKRGWSTGQRIEIGAVSFLISPLPLQPLLARGGTTTLDEEVSQERNDRAEEGSIESRGVMASNEKEVGDGGLENTSDQTERNEKTSIPIIFPPINLDEFDKGVITQIDITILAPDTPVHQLLSSSKPSKMKNTTKHQNSRKKGQKRSSGWTGDDVGYQAYKNSNNPWDPDLSSGEERKTGEDAGIEDGEGLTGREFLKHQTIKVLSKALNACLTIGSDHQHAPTMDRNLNGNGDDDDSGTRSTSNAGGVIINPRASEATQHYAQTYIQLVAHTSTGFRLGRDALYSSSEGRTSSKRLTKGKGRKEETSVLHKMKGMVDRCVEDLMDEFEIAEADAEESHEFDPQGRDRDEDKRIAKMMTPKKTKKRVIRPKRVVDTFMRDQIVVFQALAGELGERAISTTVAADGDDDDDGLSLHARTSMWVCEQMLGVSRQTQQKV